MTPLDVARLDFELHADQMTRALGAGGAPINLDRARDELRATVDALRTLALALDDE